jgi:hypothetical protein
MKTVTRGIKILTLIWVFFFVFFFLVGGPGYDGALPHDWTVVNSATFSALWVVFWLWVLSSPFMFVLWIVSFFRWVPQQGGVMDRRLALMAIFTLGLGFAGGYWVGRHPRSLPTLTSQRRPEPWIAHFKIPASISLPEKAPVIRCAFQPDDPDMALAGMFQATVTNLTDRGHVCGVPDCRVRRRWTTGA